MNVVRFTFHGAMLLGLLFGFASPALSCSTNPCDKEKLSPDIVETLVECSGSQCDKIVPGPVDTIAGCESGNCSDTKLSPDAIQAIASCDSGRCTETKHSPEPPDREAIAVRAPIYYAEIDSNAIHGSTTLNASYRSNLLEHRFENCA